jgi:hypothetical protein
MTSTKLAGTVFFRLFWLLFGGSCDRPASCQLDDCESQSPGSKDHTIGVAKLLRSCNSATKVILYRHRTVTIQLQVIKI